MSDSVRWFFGCLFACLVVVGLGRLALQGDRSTSPMDASVQGGGGNGARLDASWEAGASAPEPVTGGSAAPPRALLDGQDVGEGGGVDLLEVTVLDGAGHPLREVVCHPLSATDHPRRLLDPLHMEQTGASGQVRLASGTWLFEAPGRIRVEALIDRDRTVVLHPGVGPVIELRDFFTDRPLAGEALALTRFGLFAGYREDPGSAGCSVPRAGHRGLHRVVTGPEGRGAVDGTLPADLSEFFVHPYGALLLPPRASVTGDHLVLRARRYSLVEVHAGGAEVLSVAAVGRDRPTPQRAQPDLWSDRAKGPSELIVLHDLDVQSGRPVRCQAMVDGFGLVDFELDAARILAERRLHVDLAPRRSDGRTLVALQWFGDAADPLEAVLRSEDGTEFPITVQPGARLMVPAGTYGFRDAMGRDMSPACAELGPTGLQPLPQRKSRLTRCSLQVTTADGLEPELLMARCEGCEPVFVRGRGEAWLSAGTCRLFVDSHGAADVLVPASTPGQPVEVSIEVALEPERRWYHDLPLGERVVELAAASGIVLDPQQLDVEALRALEIRSEAELAELRARPDPMDSIQEELRRQLTSGSAELFETSERFWARVEEVDAAFSKQLRTGRLVVFEERGGGEGEPWQGRLRVFLEADHPKLFERARAAYAQRGGRAEELLAVRKVLERDLLDLIRQAAVQ